MRPMDRHPAPATAAAATRIRDSILSLLFCSLVTNIRTEKELIYLFLFIKLLNLF